MNTIAIDRRSALMVAHRGVSGLETENTCAAFVAAGNRSYFGIETDIHVTADGEFAVIHDDNALRVAGEDVVIEACTMEQLQQIVLLDKDGTKRRHDLRIPTVEEYIAICQRYDKTPVLELKNRFSIDDIRRLCERIDALGYLDRVIFISFWYENLTDLKTLYPDQPAQFLTVPREDMDWLISELASKQLDIDIQWGGVNEDFMAKCKAAGLKVNCWTVDHPDDAARLIDLGVDFITSNILE